MKYRELQAAVKAAGLNAKGSKAELEARLYADSDPQITPVVDPKPSTHRKFIYSGDPGIGKDDGWSADDPAFCEMHGYTFKLNGAAVMVPPDIAAKLTTHSHFTESK